MTWRIEHGDCLEVLREMPDESVQTCVTSPPYWGLRDYGVSGQLGLERTPEEYVAKMVEVFREVKRVLRSEGTLWLNIGDSYCTGTTASRQLGTLDFGAGTMAARQVDRIGTPDGMKTKDLVGIPWLLAFALRADGWYLRQDIIWAKPNPMPESVRDRCTKAHEYIFLMSKSERYYYDNEAIGEPHGSNWLETRKPYDIKGNSDRNDGGQPPQTANEYRNKRSVWTVTTSPFPEAHFATFPPEIPEICIKAGTKEGDTVLDPFNGAGTTGLVATRLMRNYIGIELNPEYVTMAQRRITDDAPLFNAGGLL